MKAEREVLHTEEINAKISFVNEVAQIDNEELKRNMTNLLENRDKYYEENKAEKERVPPGKYYPPTKEWLENFKKNIYKK